MEAFKKLLEDKKYDEVLEQCTDETSYEQLSIKALALMYKRQYDAAADAFVQAININEDFEPVHNFIDMDMVELYLEMQNTVIEEIKELLTTFEIDNDTNKPVKIIRLLQSVSGAMLKIINTGDSYLEIPVYNTAFIFQAVMFKDAAIVILDFAEPYFDKIIAAYRSMKQNEHAGDSNVATQLSFDMDSIINKTTYTRILISSVIRLTSILAKNKKIELEIIKTIYKRAIALQRKLIDTDDLENEDNSFRIYPYGTVGRRDAISELSKYELALKEIDPTYQPAPMPILGVPASKNSTQTTSTINSSSSTSGGCYVATAVYGSYDCPEVWTLRRFRDGTLAKSFIGRAFIHTYYAISPTIVKLFGENKWFKKMWRKPLDKMVTKLNANGTENTPYDDVEW